MSLNRQGWSWCDALNTLPFTLYDIGAGARPGDSGGGFVFRDPNSGLYYLRGIVSNKDGTVGPKETSIAAFTDVAQYVKWIYDIRIHIENEELQSETTLEFKE